MKRKTMLLLAAIVCGSLALGVWGVRYLGTPSVFAQKKTKDTHQHDAHEHKEKPKARGLREEPKGQHKSKEHDVHDKEGHKHDPHGHTDKPQAGQAKEHAHDAHKDHGHAEHAHDEEKIVRLTEAKRKELGIEVAAAQPGSLKTQLALTGTITLNTDRFVRIVSRIPGIVREVRKNLGDAVRAGEVMVIIDSRELADAKGAYLAATERVSLTADTFQREKDLWEKKISPAEDYFKAKQAHAEARIELRLAKQKLIALGFSEQALKQLTSAPEASLTRYEVVAPLAGTVIEKHLNVGEFVKDDTAIFNVADLRTVWVNLQVPPTDLGRVEKGQRVRVSAGAGLPETEGTISYLGPFVAEDTRTVPVRVELPNPNGCWHPGLFLTASLTTRETTTSVLIPQAAIQMIAGKPSVFVQTQEGFEARPVTLGQSNETHVEIIAGLSSGERYAATETFILKADLAKSEAGHQH
jgi:membrane fusion protein, heavy metal efflux system